MTPPRDEMTPIQLAEEVMKVVGDASNDTAYAALDIAGILLKHRRMEEITFVAESQSSP